jgi:hypothetical protein
MNQSVDVDTHARFRAMQEIVLDKSFVDGSPAAHVRKLCGTHHALMTEELFFELITTGHEKRRRAFCKFPDTPNPISLIPNVGELLRFEKEAGAPCAPNLRRHRIQESFQFNPRLREGTFEFEGSYAEELKSFRREIEASTRGFIERCFLVHEFFPELRGIKISDLGSALANARRSIATDQSRVKGVYRQLTAEHPNERAPDAEVIGVDWAWFRWVQVQLIATLRIFVRYQGRMPSAINDGFWIAAEHTMLDSYYVLFGTLCGALASRDVEIQEDFTLLRPDCLLLR